MELMWFSFILILFFVFDTNAMIKRTIKLNVQKNKSLENSYEIVKLDSYDLVLCGILCTNLNQCAASSLSYLTFDCELFKSSSTLEVDDAHRTIIYQNKEKPVTWPGGTYSLMKPAVGCPGNDVNWKEGSRYQDTEDDKRYNGYVVSTNMSVIQDAYNNIQVFFCTKDTESSDERDWPAGNYCILKHIACPTGFAEGYVFWDDEDDKFANAKEGTLPSGTYGVDTRIYYCCRNDGSDATAINLPTGNPFYLLRYTGGCQKVKSMSVSVETIEWECQDLGIKDIGVISPYEDGPDENVRLHFCYYYE